MKIYKLCKKYLLEHKYNLTVYVALVLLTTGIGILSPYIIGSFLDNLIEGGDINVILRFCAILGGLNIIKLIKGYITSMMHVKMQAQMGHSFNMNAIKHIQSLSLSYSNQQDMAYLSQRLGTDTISLIAFCISVLQSIMTNVAMFIIPFVILLNLNWIITVILISFLVIYAVVYLLFKKPLYKAGLALIEIQNKFFASLYEQLKHIRLIKTNSLQKEMNLRADSKFTLFKKATIHRQKVNYFYSGLDGIVSTVAQIVLFVVGGLQVLAGNFTIGMFTIFTSYFNMMIGASRYFFGLGAYYQDALVAYDRVVDILERRPESIGAKIITDINKITLHDITFSYASQENSNQIIECFNAVFTKGKIYCISGVNGTGKSTLTSLIIGMYVDEYCGQITYDGVDIRDIDMVAVRRHLIGFAEQEPVLINDSIRYNASFGYNDIENNVNFSETIEILNMGEFILGNTMDFIISENNTNTSGGEKQKISLLKVLQKDPVVMILDEPTSALDALTARKFIEHLQKIKRNKIIILITHDEAIKLLCDETINLSMNHDCDKSSCHPHIRCTI